LEKEGNTHTPIIALTAFALQGDREKFIRAGMDGYISKPIKQEEFWESIDRVLSKSHKRDFDGVPCISDRGDVIFLDPSSKKSRKELESAILNVTNYLKELIQASTTNNLDDIETAAHKMKEQFSEINEESLKGTAFKIELAARRGSLKSANEVIMQLINEFEVYKKNMIS
jgi:CheY-like chemotaxis protein